MSSSSNQSHGPILVHAFQRLIQVLAESVTATEIHLRNEKNRTGSGIIKVEARWYWLLVVVRRKRVRATLPSADQGRHVAPANSSRHPKVPLISRNRAFAKKMGTKRKECRPRVCTDRLVITRVVQSISTTSAGIDTNRHCTVYKRLTNYGKHAVNVVADSDGKASLHARSFQVGAVFGT